MPGVSSKPRGKTTIVRKPGSPSSRGFGVATKPRTGGGVEWARKKVVKGAKRTVKAAKAVKADPKGEWKSTKQVAKSLWKKKPITHMAKKVKGWVKK